MESGQQTDILVLDNVSYSLLLHSTSRITTASKDTLLQAFLHGRTQSTVLEKKTSDTINIDFVVPQGLVLGSSLFIYYINDIAYGLDSMVRLFADDTIAYLMIAIITDNANLQTQVGIVGKQVENLLKENRLPAS